MGALDFGRLVGLALAVIAGDAVVMGAGTWLSDWSAHMCRHSESCRGVDPPKQRFAANDWLDGCWSSAPLARGQGNR